MTTKYYTKTYSMELEDGRRMTLVLEYSKETFENEQAQTKLYLFNDEKNKDKDTTTYDTYERNSKNFQAWLRIIIENFNVKKIMYWEQFTYETQTLEEFKNDNPYNIK